MSLAQYVAIRGRVHSKERKLKFTPGPYHVSGSGPRMRSIKAANGRTIAHVLFSTKRQAECEGTARLLAAAPGILIELRSLVLECPCGQHLGGIERVGRPSLNRGCDRCASALAAIRKAEGI